MALRGLLNRIVDYRRRPVPWSFSQMVEQVEVRRGRRWRDRHRAEPCDVSVPTACWPAGPRAARPAPGKVGPKSPPC